VRKRGVKFTGIATSTLAVSPPSADCKVPARCVDEDPAVPVRLSDGSYRWQIRFHNGEGVSPWVPYRGIINVDTRSPASPRISSSSNPNQAKVYHSATLRFAWQAVDHGAGVAGYSYRLDDDAKGEAHPEVRTNDTTITLSGITTGTWYFHVRALDHAGNWGPTATYPVRVDVTPPGLAHVVFSRFQFNPLVDSLQVSFGVTRPSRAVRVGIYRQSDHTLMRLVTLRSLAKGQKTSVVWHGKDSRGRFASPGAYEIYIRAVDPYGHSSLTGWRDFVLDYRRIVVSLSQQKLVAYDGNKVVLSSLVTTGNRALPTPMGTYHILAKLHPFTFISPWPKSSRYYYKPAKTQYAMLFRDGGYFIHDAPWRSAFGPGTNQQLGTPGSNYTGTHGCVNVPPGVASRLFNWVQVGTVVQVTA
jgi:lipoprotein-anchoring transpeptidase ErfK/SrfK